MRRYHWCIWSMLILIITANIFDIIAPLYYKSFFDTLIQPDAKLNAGVLITILVSVFTLHTLSWLCWRGILFISNYFQPRVKADLEESSFSYLLDHSYKFFSNTFVGSLVRKVHRLSNSFERLADEVEFNFIPLFIVLTGNLIVLWWRNWQLALVLFVCVVIITAFNIGFSLWKLKFDYAKAAIDSEATGVMSDALTNSTTIKIFTSKKHEMGILTSVLERWRKAQTHVWNLDSISEAIQSGLMILAEFVMMYLAIRLWQRGLITIGDFALIQSYLISIFHRIWGIGKSIRHVYEAFADAAEMVEILETPHEVQDIINAGELKVDEGIVEFKDVHFSFRKTRKVLNDFNLVLKPHEKIALVGPSGAGKSTVTKLLSRLYDIDSGKILIDGQEIAKMTQDSLRHAIAAVPQEPILFHRSIIENIRYGRPGATDEEVFEAARRARCHEFILELSEGYQTFVGERGIKLSGGERQRVAIARAILKNAPILILDEATSSLDSESEALIQSALEELMKGKTTIVIAHRLSTIMRMDRIIVVDNGQVVDSGTHKELLDKVGIYKKLWEIQAGGFIE